MSSAVGWLFSGDPSYHVNIYAEAASDSGELPTVACGDL
jgi:hypothetical protein